MRIGIDANWAIYEKAGIGKYTKNLIENLVRYDKKNEYVLFLNYFRQPMERVREIKEIIKGSKAKVTLEIHPYPAKIKQLLLQTKLPANRIFKQEIDLFYAPFFDGVPRVGWDKMVVTIYDLAFMKFPNHRGRRLSNFYLMRTKQAINNCQKVIAISESTKKDLVKMLKVDPKKIEVVYAATGNEFRVIKNQKNIEKVVNKYLPKKQAYILAVGTLEPRKNLTRLVKAYGLLPITLQQKFKLVLVGGSGWNNSELDKIIGDLNLGEKVIKLGYVSQSDLPYLYNGASVFVYPSLYEGFGLPPLEAMACGTPVITSNNSSLSEIAGNGAKLINPYKEKEICDAMKLVLTSVQVANSLRKKGLHQAKKFSWEVSAKKTIKIFESI